MRLKESAEASATLVALPTTATANRHRRVAQLILRDTKGVEQESLGYVARMMGDSKRRLALGRSGDTEQELQQEIVDRLDKKIKQLEEQQAQQQQAQQQAQGSSPSQGSMPMEQSQPGEMKGPGDVDHREVPAGGDWGELPPAERERVTQQILRDFPGHYQTLIEQYFRSLAEPDREEPAANSQRSPAQRSPAQGSPAQGEEGNNP